MKQGKSSRDVTEGYKPRTNPHAINVRGVSQIGSSMGDHITERGKVLTNVSEPLHKGRGFSSPLGSPGTPGVGGGGRTIHRSGSQGKR